MVPSANGLQSFSTDGAPAQTFDKTRFSRGRNLSNGIAPVGGTVAFVSGDNPMTPDREGRGPLTLNLLSMRTGNQKPIALLFSPEMTQAL